jgi:hypothetical protein
MINWFDKRFAVYEAAMEFHELVVTNSSLVPDPLRAIGKHFGEMF